MSSEAGQRFCVFYPDGRMCGEPAVDTVVLASGQGGLDICAAHLDDLLNYHCLRSHRQPEQHPQGEEKLRGELRYWRRSADHFRGEGQERLEKRLLDKGPFGGVEALARQLAAETGGSVVDGAGNYSHEQFTRAHKLLDGVLTALDAHPASTQPEKNNQGEELSDEDRERLLAMADALEHDRPLPPYSDTHLWLRELASTSKRSAR